MASRQLPDHLPTLANIPDKPGGDSVDLEINSQAWLAAPAFQEIIF